MKRIMLLILGYWLLSAGLAQAITPMSDGELAGISGQALFFTNAQQGTGASAGVTFYTIGMDAQLALNANFNKLQLGCGGINGAGACDIDIDRFSLSGTPGVGGCPASGGTASCDAVLTRPAITLAISNDSTPGRQVIGFQLGAQKIVGELGFGAINSFSGYLTGTAAITMQAATNVAVTCGTGSCVGGAQADCSNTFCNGSGGTGLLTGGKTATGVNQFGYTGGQTLGLFDDYACTVGVCAAFDSLTVDIAQQTASAPVLLSGARQTQTQISGLNLGTLVENVANGLSINNSAGLPAGLVNLILPLIKTKMELSIENQMGAALSCGASTFNTCPGITPQTSTCTLSSQCVGTGSSEPAQAATLNKYVMPYNVANLHVVDVNSNNFGLSFESQAINWPGYAAAVNTGWAMYMPNAFTLNINQPLTTFTANIVGGLASAGNIVGLPGAPQNCYGTAIFC